MEDDFAIKPPDDRIMIYVDETPRHNHGGVDYIHELVEDAKSFDVEFTDAEFKEYATGLCSITPSKHSGVIYPHSVYAAYHLFYKCGKIIALGEEIVDKLLFDWCDNSTFVELFKELVTQNILTIVYYRVAVAALSDGRGYNTIGRGALDNVIPIIGNQSIARYQDRLEELCCNSPIHDVILGRLGYFAYWKWYQINNQTHNYWSNSAKNLLESR